MTHLPIPGMSVKGTVKLDFLPRAREFGAVHFTGEDVAAVEKAAVDLTRMRDDLLSTQQDKVEKSEALAYYGHALNYFKHMPGGVGLPVFQWADVTGLHPATGSVASPVLELASILFNIAVRNIQKCGLLLASDPKQCTQLLREASAVFSLIKERHTLEGSIDLRSDVLHCLSDYYMAFLYLAAYKQMDPSNLKNRQKFAGELSSQLRSVLNNHNIALNNMNQRFREAAVFYEGLFAAQHWLHVAELLDADTNDSMASGEVIDRIKHNIGPIVIKLEDIDKELRTLPIPQEQKETYQLILNELLSKVGVTHTSLSGQIRIFDGRRKPAENWVMTTLAAKVSKSTFVIEEQADALTSLPPAAAGIELKRYEAGVAAFLSTAKANGAAACADISNKFAHLPVTGILSRQHSEGESLLPKTLADKITALHLELESPSVSVNTSLEAVKSLAMTCRNQINESEEAYQAAVREDASGFEKFGARWKANREDFALQQGSKNFVSAAADYRRRLDDAAKVDAGFEQQIKELNMELIDRIPTTHEEHLKCTQTNNSIPKEEVTAMLEELKTHSLTIETGIEQMNGKLFELEQKINSEAEGIMTELLATKGGEPAYQKLLSSKMEEHKQCETQIEAIKLSLEDELAVVEQICGNIKNNDPTYDEDMKVDYIRSVDEAISGYYSIRANLEKTTAFYPQMSESCANMQTWVRDHVLSQCFDERKSLLGLENTRSVQEKTDFEFATNLNDGLNTAQSAPTYVMAPTANPYFQATAPPACAPPTLSGSRYQPGAAVCTTLTFGGQSQSATVVSGTHAVYALRLSNGEVVTDVPAACVYPAAMSM